MKRENEIESTVNNLDIINLFTTIYDVSQSNKYWQRYKHINVVI